MNELERYDRVKKVYTDVYKMMIGISGRLDFEKSEISHKPKAGTNASHGAWLANYFETEVYTDLENAMHAPFERTPVFRKALDGIDAICFHLHFRYPDDLQNYLEDVWHNAHVKHLFYLTADRAFNNDGTTDFQSIARHMIQAFKFKVVKALCQRGGLLE